MECDFGKGDKVLGKCEIHGTIEGTSIFGIGYHKCVGVIIDISPDGEKYNVLFRGEDNGRIFLGDFYQVCKKEDLKLYKPINKICENCRVKNKMNLCKGKTDDFKYCYRIFGWLDDSENVIKSITPFNDINELYNKINNNDNDMYNIKEDSLWLKEITEHEGILIGKFQYSKREYAIGYVTY